MSEVQAIPPSNRLFDIAPSMPSVSRGLRQVLADRLFAPAGDDRWSAEWGLDLAARVGAEGEISETRASLEASLAPAKPQWFGKRLPILWTLFMAGRQADPRALTVWMSETAHLLSDLPLDIVSHSIDEAIKTCRHGFMPSVGEIRQIAGPLVAERAQNIERLVALEKALADPQAGVARQRRRAEQSAIQRYHNAALAR